MKVLLSNLMLLLILASCNDSNTATKPLLTTENIQVAQKITEASKPDNSSRSSQDDWYWKNTKMSSDGKFQNWEEGAVDIVMTYRMKQNDAQPRTVKVGTINAAGEISMTLPSEIKTETKLDNLGNLFFYDIQDISNLNYVNGNSGYFSNNSFLVEKNGKSVGNLTMGNSVRTTYNLVNQSTLTMGDEGYLLYMAYLDEAGSLKGTESRTDKVRRDGTNTIEAATTVVYDLEFQPGWNYVKVEVIGKYDLDHERGLNASWFKEHQHTVVSEMPEDAAYFFRKQSY